MDQFNYKNGRLFAENVNVQDIVDAVGSPVYIYSKATFLSHLNKIQSTHADIDTTVCYAVKACSNINILKILAEAGSGFDIVSGGELYRAMQAGGNPSKIIYAGVGKTDADIIDALNAGIGCFSIESMSRSSFRLARTRTSNFSPRSRISATISPSNSKLIILLTVSGFRPTRLIASPSKCN